MLNLTAMVMFMLYKNKQLKLQRSEYDMNFSRWKLLYYTEKPAVLWHLLGTGDKKPKAFFKDQQKNEKRLSLTFPYTGWQHKCFKRANYSQELIIASN